MRKYLAFQRESLHNPISVTKTSLRLGTKYSDLKMGNLGPNKPLKIIEFVNDYQQSARHDARFLIISEVVALFASVPKAIHEHPKATIPDFGALFIIHNPISGAWCAFHARSFRRSVLMFQTTSQSIYTDT